MTKLNSSKCTQDYWAKRYLNDNTGWDLGEPSNPLRTYIDQVENKDLKILIPGAGNSYEAEYLCNLGFNNIYILDVAKAPLETFRNRVPHFPSEHIIHEDFFKHTNQYDMVIEQTFFCSFPPHPKMRTAYAKKINNILKPNGKLVGLWFNFPLTGNMEKRPFGGSKKEYFNYFTPFFKIVHFEQCYNSTPSRIGKEFFGILKKK